MSIKFNKENPIFTKIFNSWAINERSILISSKTDWDLFFKEHVNDIVNFFRIIKNEITEQLRTSNIISVKNIIQKLKIKAHIVRCIIDKIINNTTLIIRDTDSNSDILLDLIYSPIDKSISINDDISICHHQKEIASNVKTDQYFNRLSEDEKIDMFTKTVTFIQQIIENGADYITENQLCESLSISPHIASTIIKHIVNGGWLTIDRETPSLTRICAYINKDELADIESDINNGSDFIYIKTNISKELLVMPIPKEKYDKKTKTKRTLGKVVPVNLFWENDNDVFIPMGWVNRWYGSVINGFIDVERFPTHKKPFTFNMELRDYQVEIVDEILSKLDEYGSILVKCTTGMGKTVMGGYVAAQTLGLVTLIVFDMVDLAKAWKEMFNKFTDAIVWEVGKKPPPDEVHVITTTIQSMNKIPQNILDSVGLLIVDEMHKMYTSIRIQQIMRVSPRIFIANTATPNKNNGLHKIIPLMCAEMVERNNTREFIVRRIKTPFKFEITFKLVHGMETPDWSSIDSQMSLNEQRNQEIINVITDVITKENRKPLVLSSRREHVEYLCNKFNNDCEQQKLKLNGDYMIGGKKNYSDPDVLFGSWHKLSVGFDEELCCDNFGGKRIDTIILTMSIYEESLVIQIIGRAMRSTNKVLVIDFVDDNTICEKHWRERCRIFKQQKGKIKYETLSLSQ